MVTSFLNRNLTLAVGLTLISTLGSVSHAGRSPLPVLSKSLEMKDLEQVQKIVMKYRDQNLHMEDKEEELRVSLFDAIRALFARRDHDGARSKIMNTLRASLGEDESDVLDRVIDDSIEGLKDHEAPVQEQKTHYTILHNFIKEYQGRKKDFTAQIAKIRDAEIKLSDELKKENRLSTMTDSDSPSKAATRLIGEKS